jgi:N-acetylglucosaminyl-diphospho-decaprenol L-rhamnosyltransferase
MPSGDSRVSVVMITRDRREEVLRSLGELAGLPERPRVILVDNGSTDGTAAAVAEEFPAVEILSPGANLGAAGRNLGVERAETPYVALCDDDTWWEPGSLSRAADLFEGHPRLALVNARILVGPERREDPICRELLRSPLRFEPDLPGHPLLGFLAGASVVRRRAFLEAGGFERRLFIGGEEELLAIDLATRGWALRYVPELVVYHFPSARRDPPGRRRTMIRNRLWSAWLRRPLPSALRHLVRTLRTEPWDRASLQGFTAALSGLGWVLPRRRVVPAEIEAGLRLLEATWSTGGPVADGSLASEASAESG